LSGNGQGGLKLSGNGNECKPLDDGTPPGARSHFSSGTAAGVARRLDDDAAEMRVAMRLNPRYPALLDAYFACRIVGADPAAAAAIEHERAGLLASAEAARNSTGRGLHSSPSLLNLSRF